LPLEGLFNLDHDLGALIRVLETDLAWKEGSRLGDRAHEWLSRDRARALLLRGAALGDAERWKQRRPPKAPAPTQEVLDLISLAAKPRRGANVIDRRLARCDGWGARPGRHRAVAT
jgi:hypothetical protein